MKVLGLEIWGLGFRDSSFGFRQRGPGLRGSAWGGSVKDSGSWVYGLGRLNCRMRVEPGPERPLSLRPSLGTHKIKNSLKQLRS